MARAGTANYSHSSFGPVMKDIHWRECMTKERQRHKYGPASLGETNTCGFKDVGTTANDFHGRTWKILNHSYSSAAGKSSYFYSVSKPSGSAVQLGLTSASTFDPWQPGMLSFPRSPMPSGRERKRGPFSNLPDRSDTRAALAVSIGGTHGGGLDPFQAAMADKGASSTALGRRSRSVGSRTPSAS